MPRFSPAPGRGGGTALLLRLESEGQARGRMLLFLDTSTGENRAGPFSGRLGRCYAGGIPDYAANPDGRLVAPAIFTSGRPEPGVGNARG